MNYNEANPSRTGKNKDSQGRSNNQQPSSTMGAPPSGSAEGTKAAHQKMRSIDVQKPLINPWLAANHIQSHTGKHLTSKNIQMQEQ